jgi:acetamidase/formamidase
MAVGRTEHVIDPTRVHHRWQRTLPPVLEIDSGDVVEFDLRVAGDGQITPQSTAGEVQLDFETIYILSGPIYVKGAAPGDTLQIDILRLRPGHWGWTMILSDLGLLPEDFPEPYLKIFDLTDGHTARLADGVRVPLAPFLGTMGVHPYEPDGELPFPPHRGGGNMDNRHLREGATLWLPIWCEGGLFSCGDAHAVQGDGEVCVSALECPMQATLRFTLHQRSIAVPQFTTPPGPLTPQNDSRGYHATMGISDDLMDCAKTAVRAMIGWIVENHGLSAQDAYVLCSLAGDLKIHEVVDAGVWNVGMTLPLCVFDAGE